MDNVVLVDREDFEFNDICENMYHLYRSRLIAKRTQQSTISDHFGRLALD
jgi:hypothetical protein